MDEYSGASAGYSLRLLSADYSGDCITVRRASDNATQNIGFDDDGVLDITSLESFCAGTDGFVATWYDQSGNGNNAVQLTASEQPKIVSSGSVILENGKPTIEFDGVDDTIQYDFSPDAAQPFTLFYVRRYRDLTSTYVGLGIDTSQSTGYVEIKTATILRTFYGSYLASFTATTNQGLWYSLGNGVNSEIGLDNATAITGNAGTGEIELLSIGSAGGQGLFSPLNVQEVIVYTTDQSSNRTGIQENINEYFNIY